MLTKQDDTSCLSHLQPTDRTCFVRNSLALKLSFDAITNDPADYFYVDQETTPVEDIDQAKAFQRSLLRFVKGDSIGWPIYGASKQIENITTGGYETVKLPEELKARCDMINQVVLDPANGA
jgi:hypothetical protein